MAGRSAHGLSARLKIRAGYPDFATAPKPRGGRYAGEFYDVLMALYYIGNRKVDDYGDGRMTMDPSIHDYDLKMLYSDLYRKHIRINEQMAAVKRLIWEEPMVTGTHDALMETLGDLAVYAVRGIQIIARLEEQAHGSKSRTHHGRRQRTRR